MKYLADLLTLVRVILAATMIVASVANLPMDTGTAFLIFVVAELTDAFDGTLAMRFPFPKNKAPWYRKYAAKYDMFADALTAIAAMVFFTLRINLIAGLAIIVSYGVAAAIVDWIVYGKLFGHPDDCAPGSLMQRDFLLAKKIIMARRTIYLLLIGMVAVWMLCVSGWRLEAKIVIMIMATVVAVFLWFFLAQRRHHISRDAVDIEEKLASKK